MADAYHDAVRTLAAPDRDRAQELGDRHGGRRLPGLAAVRRPLAEPRRGWPADCGRAVGAGSSPVRRLLGGPAAGADRPLRGRGRLAGAVPLAPRRARRGPRRDAVRRAGPARRAGAASGPRLTAATAALFIATPLFGGTVVNGELLGLPFLVGGIWLVAAAAVRHHVGGFRSPGRRCRRGARGAGQAEPGDVFVFAAVCCSAAGRPEAARPSAGARATLGIVVWAAWALGTVPGELWDAVVIFRLEAAGSWPPTAATPRAAGQLVGALAASGVPRARRGAGGQRRAAGGALGPRRTCGRRRWRCSRWSWSWCCWAAATGCTT